MNILNSLEPRGREIISFVGGGGKTTLMLRLADEIPTKYPTLITTTTKIFIPPADRYPLFLAGEGKFDQDAINRLIAAGLRPTLGSEILPGNKLGGVTPQQFDDIAGWQEIDYILAEADGSNGRSLKGHLIYEPVIPRTTTLLVIVAGADALGKRLDSRYVHRPEIAAELTAVKPGSIITPEFIATLIKHPRGIMRQCPPQARKIVVFNKIDYLASLAEAYKTARLLAGDMIEKVLLCSAIREDPVVDIVCKN